MEREHSDGVSTYLASLQARPTQSAAALTLGDMMPGQAAEAVEAVVRHNGQETTQRSIWQTLARLNKACPGVPLSSLKRQDLECFYNVRCFNAPEGLVTSADDGHACKSCWGKHSRLLDRNNLRMLLPLVYEAQGVSQRVARARARDLTEIPRDAVELPVRRQERYAPTRSDYEKVLQYVLAKRRRQSLYEDVRDHTIVVWEMSIVMRGINVTRLTRQDFVPSLEDARFLQCPGLASRNKREGAQEIPPELRRLLKQLSECYPSHEAPDGQPPFIYRGNDGTWKPIDAGWLSRNMCKWSERALGPGKRFGSHGARYGGLTEMVRRGESTRTVRDAAGHSRQSPNHPGYIKLLPEDFRDFVAGNAPVGGSRRDRVDPCPRCGQPKLVGIRLCRGCMDSEAPGVRARGTPGDLLRRLDLLAEEALVFDGAG